MSAKSFTLVDAGSETNLNPWPLESDVTIVLGVVAVIAIVAEFSTKVPRIRFARSSAVSVVLMPLHSIWSELMIPNTPFTGRSIPWMLFMSVNQSNTHRLCTRRDAVPRSRST